MHLQSASLSIADLLFDKLRMHIILCNIVRKHSRIN